MLRPMTAFSPPARVLVTGASGHLGGRVVRALLAAGYAVRATHRPGDPDTALEGLTCERAPADLLDPGALAEVARDMDAVCHVAAWVTFRPTHYGAQWTVNVGGTLNLLAAAREAGVRRFVHTATVNTLGIPAPGTLGDEHTPFDWARYHLGYMDSKRAAETEALAANRSGFETLSVNPVTLFGPGDALGSAGTYLLQADRGRLLLAPPGGTCIAHVDDVARGVRLALERAQPGSRTVLGGEAVPYGVLYRWCNEEVGRPGPLATLPATPLRLAGRLADRLRRAGGPALPWSEGLAVAATSPLYYSAVRASRTLGYRSRPARQAVAEHAAWLRDRHRLHGRPRGAPVRPR